MSSPKASPVVIAPSVLATAISALADRHKERLRQLRLQKLRRALAVELARLEEIEELCADLGFSRLTEHFESLRSGVSEHDIEAHKSRIEQISAAVETCQQRVLDEYRQRAVEERADLKELAAIASASEGGGVTIGTFISSLDGGIRFAGDARAKAVVDRYLDKARTLLDEFAREHPSHSVSSETIAVLDQLTMSVDEAQASELIMRFSTHLEKEVAASLQHQAAETERAKALERERLRTTVGAMVASSLQEMGWRVSSIEETCFVEDGALYTKSSKHPDHVVRITVGPEGKRLRSEPIRTEPDSALAQDATVRTINKADRAFDAHWCSDEGLGELHKRLKAKGVETRFRVIDQFAPPVAIEAASSVPDVEKQSDDYTDELLELLAADGRLMERKLDN